MVLKLIMSPRSTGRWKRPSPWQRWARRVFFVTGTGTASVPVPVPVPEFPFLGPLLPFQGPFFVRSSFRSGIPFFFFGTDLEQTRSSYRYYRSSYRSYPFQLPLLVSSSFRSVPLLLLPFLTPFLVRS